MKPYRLATAIVGLVIFSSSHCILAQEFKNITASFDGEKILISYDLIPGGNEAQYSVAVYSSHDNYAVRLINVIGDVGKNINPGNGKNITWYLKRELTANFSDNLVFKLVAEPMGASRTPATAVSFIYPVKNDDLKKGKDVKIQWRGGDPEDVFQLSLYEGERQLKDISKTENNNSYTWNVPKTLEKGKNYKLKLTNVKNSGDYTYSGEFQVKKGTPFYIFAIPVAAGAIAGGVIAAGGGDGGDEPDPNGGNGTDLESLPAPIDPD